MRVCAVPDCPELYPSAEGSKCRAHRRQADRRRGTARERGYSSPGHRSFRAAVLARDLICVVCELAEATVADHFPRGRDELVHLGLDPDDPSYGRGLCHRCHSVETAANQPGGWRT